MIDWNQIGTFVLGGGILGAALILGRKLQILDDIKTFLSDHKAAMAEVKATVAKHETRISVIEKGCAMQHAMEDD